MINNRTEHLSLALPNEQNELEDDCPRLISSLKALDSHAKTSDARLQTLEQRAGGADSGLEGIGERVEQAEARLDGHDASIATKAEQTALEAEVENRAEAVRDEAQARALADNEEAQARKQAVLEEAQARTQAMQEHDASLTVHDALVKRITVGSLSPVIGICNVETGGGSGVWFNIDAEGQPVSPPRSYFVYHPVYNALRRVLVDGQMMQEHKKFYYRAIDIGSGPFAGKKGRLISPEAQDGFKPYPSFMKSGKEIDVWYCGTYASTDDGGSPKKLGSRPGKAPFVNVNFPTMRSYCENRNTGGVEGFGMWNIYHASEIQLLVLIEAATPDTQADYGRGRVDTTSAAAVDALDVSTASWRGHVGLWGNVWQMCDGLDVTTAGKLRLHKNDGSGEWVDTGYTCPAYDGVNWVYMQTFKTGSGAGFDFDDIFFPATTTTSAAAATIPDGFWGRYGSAGNVCYFGAAWHNAALAGLFACSVDHPASHAGTSIGCRLAKW